MNSCGESDVRVFGCLELVSLPLVSDVPMVKTCGCPRFSSDQERIDDKPPDLGRWTPRRFITSHRAFHAQACHPVSLVYAVYRVLPAALRGTRGRAALFRTPGSPLRDHGP